MKLSLVEPFGARSAPDDTQEAEELQKPLFVVPIKEEPTEELEEDSQEQEEKRSFARTVDYLEEQKLKNKVQLKGDKFRAKVNRIYQRSYEMEQVWDLHGHQYEAKV